MSWMNGTPHRSPKMIRKYGSGRLYREVVPLKYERDGIEVKLNAIHTQNLENATGNLEHSQRCNHCRAHEKWLRGGYKTITLSGNPIRMHYICGGCKRELDILLEREHLLTLIDTEELFRVAEEIYAKRS